MNHILPNKSPIQILSEHYVALYVKYLSLLPEKHQKEVDIKNLFKQLEKPKGIFHQMAAYNGGRTIPISEIIYIKFIERKPIKGYPKIVRDAMRLGWNPANKMTIRDFMEQRDNGQALAEIHLESLTNISLR